jgi:hypothetical protein
MPEDRRALYDQAMRAVGIHTDPAAVAGCALCDRLGYRPNGRICDHIDHAEAARRGMAMIREAMGWTT